jgi:hypothetical protein
MKFVFTKKNGSLAVATILKLFKIIYKIQQLTIMSTKIDIDIYKIHFGWHLHAPKKKQ